MRRLFIASLLAAGLAGTVVGHRTHPKLGGVEQRRKSLGFGPSHPHAVFLSDSAQLPAFSGFAPSASADPFKTAKRFVEELLGDQLSDPSTTYRIRKDSYTDNNTGVTHVYVRQMVNGLEVADGDMNINVKDGAILSFGNSFYNGPAPEPMALPSQFASHPHREYCELLGDQVDSTIALTQMQGDQVPLGASQQPHISTLLHLHSSNCRFQELPYELASRLQNSDPLDLRPALLQFMIAATPKDTVVEDILANFDSHIEKMSLNEINHFAPGEEQLMEVRVEDVPDTVNPVKAKLAYIQVPTKSGADSELQLVWKFEVEMQDNWYEAAVSAHAPHRIVSVVDWASDAPFPPPSKKGATYQVFGWGLNDPTEGARTIEKENFDNLASPHGWHSIPVANDPSQHDDRRPVSGQFRETTTTWGNNVFAQENWEGQNRYVSNYRPDSPELAFHYTYDPKPTEKTDGLEESKKYINTTITQLFYTTNKVHDLYYRYGFDEVAGNFQQYNFGRGGKENDGVLANAQDGSGYNNANFMTPPDGQNGRMRMYLWNTALPFRDGDLEAGIVIHELSHGLSTRLTGGPANSGCLGWGESGGMGEGWGDWLATTIRAEKGVTDYPMGAWAANRDRGIRNFVYSLDEGVNPSTYKTLDKPGYWGVHAIGEVWAEILWVVSQGLVKKHGYSKELYPPHPDTAGNVPEANFYHPRDGAKPLVPKHGNTLAIQLVINGMKLQPCRPSFFDARDAIIQADQVLTGGENFCTLWEGFSSRGLGPDSRVEGRTPWGGGIRTDGRKLPTKCATESPVPPPPSPPTPEPKEPEEDWPFRL